MGDISVEAIVGVLVRSCDLEEHPLVWEPSVSVDLVDTRIGQSILSVDALKPTTKPFLAVQKRSQTPVWEEILKLNYSYQQLCNTINPHYLLLFELTDYLPEPSSIFKMKHRNVVRVRVAWAFLKPVAADGTVYVECPLRLQLYKIHGKCPTSHQSCPLLHLYTDHKRKKYPGSIFVQIQPTQLSTPATTFSQARPHNGNLTDVNRSTIIPATPLLMSQWSRLPTQSCKIPNSKYAEVFVSNRGASCLAFSHSGVLLACASFAKLLVFDVVEKKQVAHLVGHTGLIYQLDFAPDDCLLLSVSGDCCAMVWNLSPICKSPLYILPHATFLYCGRWVNNRLLLTGGKDYTLRCWELRGSTFDILDEADCHEGFITAMTIRGETVLFTGDSTGAVLMWTSQDNKWRVSRKYLVRELEGAAIDAIHLHSGHRRLLVTGRMHGSLMLDLSTGASVLTYSQAEVHIRSMTALSPCGSLVLSFSPRNRVNVWEFDTGHLLANYNNIFPATTDSNLTGLVLFHPFEHMVAFGVLGCSCSVVILTFNHNSDAGRLGLTLTSAGLGRSREEGPVKKQLTLTLRASQNDDDNGDSLDVKLANIVRNIDKMLAVKREIMARVSSSTVRHTLLNSE